MQLASLPTGILDFCVASFLDTKDLRQVTDACKTLQDLLKQTLFNRRMEWLHEDHVPLHPVITWLPLPTHTKATRVRTCYKFPVLSHVRSVHSHVGFGEFDWLASSNIRFLFCNFGSGPEPDEETLRFPFSLRGLSIALANLRDVPSMVFPEALQYLDIPCSLCDVSLNDLPFPAGLQRLSLSVFSLKAQGACLPRGLKYLHLRTGNMCEFSEMLLPEGLHTFTIFKMHLAPRLPKLPTSLRRLWLYSMVLYTGDSTLPEGLRELRIDSGTVSMLLEWKLPSSLERLILGTDIEGDLGDLELPAGLRQLIVGYHPNQNFCSMIDRYGVHYVLMDFDVHQLRGRTIRDVVLCSKRSLYANEKTEESKQAADKTGTYQPRRFLGCRVWAVDLEKRVNAKRAAGMPPLKVTFCKEEALGSWQWEDTFEHQVLFCE